LHAEVQVQAHERTRLEHLCRYVARGPIASERLSLSPEGKVIYQLRRPWRDGTTHILFSPMTFIERLAALVPRPRVHLLTYHGVLAPASTWRDTIIPSPPALTDELALGPSEPRASLHEGQGSSSPAALSASLGTDLSSAGPALEHNPPWLEDQPELLDQYRRAASHPTASRSSSPDPYTWSQLMRRVFSIDVLRCASCGGRRELISMITDPPVIRRILRHLELPADPPPLSPAYPRPELAFEFGD